MKSPQSSTTKEKPRSARERGDERMAISAKRLFELQEQFQKKADAAYDNYQEIGNGSYLNTHRKYEELVEIVRLAKARLGDSCGSCERHRRNVSDLIKRYEGYQNQGLTDLENFKQFVSDLYSILF